VGYNGKNLLLFYDTTEENSSNILKFSVVYSAPDENLFCCISRRKKISSAVSQDGGKPHSLYPTPDKMDS
jgi:hypothetical protein